MYSCSAHLIQAIRRSQKGIHKIVAVMPVEPAVCALCGKKATWAVNPQ